MVGEVGTEIELFVDEGLEGLEGDEGDEEEEGEYGDLCSSSFAILSMYCTIRGPINYDEQVI